MSKTNKNYLTLLNRSISNLEDIYNLNLLYNGQTRLQDNRIDIVIPEIQKIKSEQNQYNISSINVLSNKYFCSISYLYSRMSYKKLLVLDYSLYIKKTEIIKTLNDFLYEDESLDLVKLNFLVEILYMADSISENIKSLGYRVLRLFLIAVIYGNLADASILAKLMISQISLGGLKNEK